MYGRSIRFGLPSHVPRVTTPREWESHFAVIEARPGLNFNLPRIAIGGLVLFQAGQRIDTEAFPDCISQRLIGISLWLRRSLKNPEARR